MQIIRKINDELSIAGQITSDQLKQLRDEGYRSVLNLRSPEERHVWLEEADCCNRLALQYSNIAIQVNTINRVVLTQVLLQIEAMPKPLLIHCGSAERAAAIVLMYIAIRQGATLEQAFQQVEKLGLFKVLA